MKSVPSPFALILRENGYKATPSRLSLLQILEKADSPLSINHIMKESNGNLTQATLYRALESLVDIGMVRQIDIGHTHAHYELETKEKHHHHIICKKCGKIEDVDICEIREIETIILKQTKAFALIQNHSLEFFGICKTCNNKDL